ncbi:hypothetical protein SDRG_15021 [Saprolegnia diclina VS20]|uniref:Uncharacterized protein n=1 Tax=Saprolegnia diclina (strain VS20) TaxID=1156394 RepID=T0Q177_SAPDV|nr:hypothetical protein SDRG_15021 [Saprolegnia diclina VS20]EQC27120.1 hypothetical protein SDRG_15021 [Saprolegnia diclina VS20]|eukprot:XP_008619406.1 hypothetical protein SDRG_15021 [Saprolegnia diclina VS20]
MCWICWRPHAAELLTQCAATIFSFPTVAAATTSRRAIVKHCVLLDAYLTRTATNDLRISGVDGLPPLQRVLVDHWAFDVCSDIALGVAAAVNVDPSLVRSPLVDAVLEAFRGRFDRKQIDDLQQSGAETAESILVLALHAKRLDDNIFKNVTTVWGLAVP